MNSFETAEATLKILVATQATWSHDQWRRLAVRYMKYGAGPLNAALRVLVDCSDPEQPGGGETYSDRLWRCAVRVALGCYL